ncbi:complex I assembly factor TIMMDC1, mitochondrial-like isoform X2 [Asterias amurensis]
MNQMKEIGADEHQEERKETGWDRVKEAYTYDKDNRYLPRELHELVLMAVLGMAGGYVYGGVPASRHARERYIEKSNAAIYSSRLEATGASYNAGTRGLIRYGYRWGWRTAVLATGFHGISTCLGLYRDKQDLTNYVSAAAITGSLFRFNLGLRGLVGGAFVGVLVGLPAGLALLGVQKMQGETFLEKNKRLRREAVEDRQKELLLRMQVTPLLLNEMGDSLNRAKSTDTTSS